MSKKNNSKYQASLQYYKDWCERSEQSLTALRQERDALRSQNERLREDLARSEENVRVLARNKGMSDFELSALLRYVQGDDSEIESMDSMEKYGYGPYMVPVRSSHVHRRNLGSDAFITRARKALQQELERRGIVPMLAPREHREVPPACAPIEALKVE